MTEEPATEAPVNGGQLVRSSMDRTWTVVGAGGSLRVPGIPGEEDRVG